MNSPDYDDSTAFLGDWGPFQRTVFALLCLSIIPNGFTGLSMVFMGDTPAHHCLIPAALNITDEWRNASIPLDEDSRLTKCARHRVDIVKNYSDRGLLPWVDVNVSSIPREACMDGWEYDTGTYISTIVTEFHPVEDRIHHAGMDGLLRNCATGCRVDEAFTMDDLADSIYKWTENAIFSESFFFRAKIFSSLNSEACNVEEWPPKDPGNARTGLDGELVRVLTMGMVQTLWDLVCSDDWRVPLSTSLFFCGVLTGSMISGPISDRFGRKIVLFVTMMIQTVFTLIQVFSSSWLIFCILFFIAGMGQISNYLVAFALGMEILSPSIRDLYSTLGVCLFFSIGYMMLPLAAYFLRDWRTLLLVLTIPGFFCIALWWFIPESPRWLLSQGRVDEAEAILRKAAKMNGVKAPDVIFPLHQSRENARRLQTYSLCDLVKSSNIRCITFLLCLVWFAVSIGYNALSLNTSSLHGNIYLNCFLSAVVEVPALIMAWLMLRHWPRRLCMTSTLSLGGLLLLFIHLIPEPTSCFSLLEANRALSTRLDDLFRKSISTSSCRGSSDIHTSIKFLRQLYLRSPRSESPLSLGVQMPVLIPSRKETDVNGAYSWRRPSNPRILPARGQNWRDPLQDK
ncbi:Solute carrier family 22 member 5 [Anabarilius grahami]|uniref:Solute carrier family 22 member 5 n=1 Tax=Anabarilius grahami TaxID=495550 RepID=A0A3N0XVN9_ANAGA|nr:Solute carrier family 22 member 5 [Anabarilius grahami]